MNKKCQIFTPKDYVERLLDKVGYTNDLYGKKILENSCGDGNILSVVVQRYIDDCRRKGFSRTKIRNGLCKDIHGIEIDPKHYRKCLKNLNEIVEQNDILPVEWNFRNTDYLKTSEDKKYDFIVGNPPYITYSELNKENQIFLKTMFESCKNGKFDYCYAFIEKSIEDLSSNGKMAYLIPSSIFKTVFGENLRKLILPYLVMINDYTQEKMFSNALVKSAIVVISKATEKKEIHYIDKTKCVKKIIQRNQLGAKWSFENNNIGKLRFGDYFKVSHVVATLCNKAFVVKEWKLDEKGDYLCDGIIIERDVIREATSPKLLRTGKTEKIIFPYRYDNNHKLVRYDEKIFKKRYPGAYKHLSRFREELNMRDSDISSKWFEYGRSQALSGLNCEKALISTIVSGKILVYKLSKNVIPYAGMYIVPKTNRYSIEKGINILLQERFYKYAQDIGIHINGSSVRITSKDIEDYRF